MTNTETLTYPIWQNAPAVEATVSEFEEAEALDTSKSNDIQLAQSAAGGNMSAFEELYNRHHRRVYSLCLRMLQNTAEAEDLTQEVFIQLYRKIGSFRGDSAFTTWLHRLTVNQVLMHFRKRRKAKHQFRLFRERKTRLRCRLLIKSRLIKRLHSFLTAIAMCLCCTMSKVMNTRK
jgi:hypothetical protein